MSMRRLALLLLLLSAGLLAQAHPVGTVVQPDVEIPEGYDADFDGAPSSQDVYYVERDGQKVEVLVIHTSRLHAVVKAQHDVHLEAGEKLTWLRRLENHRVGPTPVAAVTRPEPDQSAPARDEVPIRRYSGVYSTHVELNGGSTYEFIVDSGASDMCVNQEVAAELQEAGSLTNLDMLEPRVYRIADGSSVRCERFMLHSVKIGKTVVRDVPCSINPGHSPLLLGQAFLKRVSPWKLDSDKSVLVLHSDALPATASMDTNAPASNVPLPGWGKLKWGARLRDIQDAYPAMTFMQRRHGQDTYVETKPGLKDFEVDRQPFSVIFLLNPKGELAGVELYGKDPQDRSVMDGVVTSMEGRYGASLPGGVPIRPTGMATDSRHWDLMGGRIDLTFTDTGQRGYIDLRYTSKDLWESGL